MAPQCPDPDALTGFAEGVLVGPDRTSIEAHLDSCPDCARVVSELARVYARSMEASVAGVGAAMEVTVAATGHGGVPPVEPRVDKGTQIGRYVVVERVGSGAMGVVYAAFDPDLDRKVALKVLRGSISEGPPALRNRLLREAQAMAKLAHPNVVTVHDVGTWGTQVFLAMEFVDGQTLRGWLQSRPQWPKVADMFQAAGRGLAAAHAEGLVHRDFKPDNVLIGRDGRAQVTDFGLARPTAQAEPPGAGSDLTDASGRPLTMQLTEHGALVGTPAYMSPEQLRGQAADARSDQFSFCVALFEALYGIRPFAGRTLAELATSVSSGQLAPIPAGSRVPRWLHRVVARGLAVEPQRRFATMEALLAEVARRRGGRRLWLSIAGTAVGTASIVGALHLASRSDPVCRGGEARLAQEWGPADQARVRQAFEAVELPYAEQSLDRVQRRLDGYRTDWLAMYRDACEATEVYKQQSERVLDLRMACLDDRAQRLGALVSVLTEADADVVRESHRVLGRLPSIDLCADLERLEVQVDKPDRPEVQEAAQRLKGQLVRARALISAGRFDEAKTIAEQTLGAAQELGYDPLTAEAEYRLAVVMLKLGKYVEAEKHFDAAVWLARSSGHVEVEVSATTQLIGLVGDELAKHDEAERWARHARAVLERSDTRGPEEAELLSSLGSLHFSKGEFDQSRRYHEQALAIRERIHGEGDYETATSLHNLGGALVELGELDKAKAVRTRALAAAEEALGPAHPRLASYLGGLGHVLYEQGEYDEALALYERGLQIRMAALGPEHPQVASSLNNIGAMLAGLGRNEESLDHYSRALALREKTLGQDHPLVAESLGNVGGALDKLGRSEEAIQKHERSLAIRRAAFGPDHPDLAGSLNRLANAIYDRGDYEQALEYYLDALRIRERTLGPDHPTTGMVHANLGGTYRRLKKHLDAVRHQERAVAIFSKALGPDHPDVASAQTGLAKALAQMGRVSEGLKILQAALAIRRKRLGDDHEDTADSWREIGRIQHHQRDYVAAADSYGRATTVYEQNRSSKIKTAEARWGLVKALLASGADPPRARQQAQKARGEFETLPGGPDRARMAEIDAAFEGDSLATVPR